LLDAGIMGEESSGSNTGRVALLSAAITGGAVILAAVIPVLIGAVHVSTVPAPTITVTATPTVTVTVTAHPSGQAASGQGGGSHPGAGSGGVVRNLSVPLVQAPAYMSIDFDTGAVTESNGGEQAYYQMMGDTNVPELQINVPFSLDVNSGNAGKQQCSMVTTSDPSVHSITRLSKGKLVCVQGNDGIGLLEILQAVSSSASTLRLRETYWSNSGG
jgi:hypothetical protein